MPAPVALGLHARTGWATLVGLAGPVASPSVIERRRLELTPRGTPAQVYHAARHLEPEEAERFVEEATDAVGAAARRALRHVLAELGASGAEVIATGIVLGRGRVPSSLPAILASHPLLHAAEGELYRRALAEAATSCDLPVHGVEQRSLYDRAENELGASAADLRRRLLELGRSVGPPWRLDHKDAALVAWLALFASRPKPTA
jgi:hypothetical protein